MELELPIFEKWSNPDYTGATSKVPAYLQAAENYIDSVPGDVFVGAMRNAATGVNIVTTDGAAGRFGVTVSAFSSVSAEPPLVLVCINRKSPLAAAICANGCFGVNVLSSDQRDLAASFAGYPSSGVPYDFGTTRWEESVSGAPVLAGAVAGFDCVLATSHNAGSHRIFIGRVVGATSQSARPLLYTNREYGRFCRSTE
jgi:flavin reductase (DIM6/NTAB) family NADH-FMN oxidoreductase RutF